MQVLADALAMLFVLNSCIYTTVQMDQKCVNVYGRIMKSVIVISDHIAYFHLCNNQHQSYEHGLAPCGS